MHTNDVVMLCEAAGYDIIIVETVGIGQVTHTDTQRDDFPNPEFSRGRFLSTAFVVTLSCCGIH